MTRWLLLVMLLGAQAAYAQAVSRPSTFHRLLIFNERGELLVVRLADSGRWVTPGWYQDDRQMMSEGLDRLAADFGAEGSGRTLRGVFSLSGLGGDGISTRLVHTLSMRSDRARAPAGISATKWLPVEEAAQRISLPHIRDQLLQITRCPHVVWGGSIQLPGGEPPQARKYSATFYPLFSAGAASREATCGSSSDAEAGEHGPVEQGG